MAILWTFLRTLLVTVLLGILVIRLLEGKMTFFPSPYPVGNWDTRPGSVSVEDVFFATADGVRIHGWWAESPGAGVTILYFHGNAGNITHRIDNIAFLTQIPANVLAVDYRGYGRSEGRPSESGVYLDAQAAYDYLIREGHLSAGRLIVLGQSLGTAVAVDLAAKRPVAALILEAGFPSARRVVQEVMKIPGLHLILRSRFDSAEKLRTIQVPVLVAHCTRDPVIPFSLGKELFAAASEPKVFVEYDTDCHEPLFVARPNDYLNRLRAFIRQTAVRQP